MYKTLFTITVLASWFLLAPAVSPAAENSWQAGTASVNITPQQLMWMSGYGGRNHPAEGKLTDLWAKCLVLEDPSGHRAAVVSLDLVGIGRELSLPIREEIGKQHGLDLSQIAFCTSHTHTGPVVGTNLRAMYFYDDDQEKLVQEYSQQLSRDIVNVVGAAIKDLEPCQLFTGNGECSVAVNRRENPESQVPALREAGQLKGPIDHSVPVLKAVTAAGKLKGILFGYACHATVLSFYQWSGDYPGFAMLELEKNHPGTTAIFFAGCGADQNPLPRRTVELAQQYGQRLAQSVDQVLAEPMQAVSGKLQTAYAEIPLARATTPSRAELLEIINSGTEKNRFQVGNAKHLLASLESGGEIPRDYPYPIQTWSLGQQQTLVVLGGEVVVDYVLRLKRDLKQPNLWVAGYSNDVMAYIPSERVLKEGGYEGASSMIYYGFPSPWAPDLEDKIVKKVKQQVKSQK